jgi:hypothetical protein
MPEALETSVNVPSPLLRYRACVGTGKSARAAVDGHSLIGAGGYLVLGLGAVARSKVHVVGDKEVEMAVAVVVEKCASGAKAIASVQQAGFGRHIGKCAVAVVAVEAVVAVVGEEQVLEAVVVVVADADAHSPAGIGESGFGGHIGKRAVAVVVIEPVAGARRSAFERTAAEQEDVHPAVVVVVEEGASAAHRFHDVGDLAGCRRRWAA